MPAREAPGAFLSGPSDGERFCFASSLRTFAFVWSVGRSVGRFNVPVLVVGSFMLRGSL